MTARFQRIGEPYESVNILCELRIPRHQAERTRIEVAGKIIFISFIVRSFNSPVYPGENKSTKYSAPNMPKGQIRARRINKITPTCFEAIAASSYFS